MQIPKVNARVTVEYDGRKPGTDEVKPVKATGRLVRVTPTQISIDEGMMTTRIARTRLLDIKEV